MNEITKALTKVQQHLEDSDSSLDTNDALNYLLDAVTELTTVVSMLVDRLPEVQAIDAASQAQTDKDSA